MVSLSVNLTNDPLTALRATGWNRGPRDSPIGPCPRGYQAGWSGQASQRGFLSSRPHGLQKTGPGSRMQVGLQSPRSLGSREGLESQEVALRVPNQLFTEQQATNTLGSWTSPTDLWLRADRAGKPGFLHPSAAEGPARNRTRKHRG